MLQKESTVLNFLRSNIPPERVSDVEKRFLGLNDYVVNLTETVYRSHKGSWKVDSSKARGVKFLQSILYLLTGELIKDEDLSYWEEKIPQEIEKMFQKHFVRNSYFRKYAVQYSKARVGRKTDGYVRIDPYVFNLIGGEIFFYLTLRSLLKVIKKAQKYPEYDYRVMKLGKGHSCQMMTWEEAITEHLVSELKTV